MISPFTNRTNHRTICLFTHQILRPQNRIGIAADSSPDVLYSCDSCPTSFGRLYPELYPCMMKWREGSGMDKIFAVPGSTITGHTSNFCSSDSAPSGLYLGILWLAVVLF